MKIGIISDIHGYPEKFKKTMELFKDCDMVLCAGDILYHGPRNPILEGYKPQGLIEVIAQNKTPMLIARGNCDADVDIMVLGLPVLPNLVLYEKDGIRFMVMHGHDLDDEGLKRTAEAYRVDVMITGHTHVRKHEYINGTHFINPGSIGVPKGDGIPSAALFENGEIKFVNIEDGSIIEKTGF